MPQRPLFRVLLSLAVLGLVGACDSGFKKVAARQSASEPEPQPEPVPEPDVDVDAAPPGFATPRSNFVPGDASVPLSDLGSDLQTLCEDQQRRFAEVLSYFSRDEQLCTVIAVMESIDGAITTSAFNRSCGDSLDECLADGPSRPLSDFVAPAVTRLNCEAWAVDSCDPSTGDALVCFDDLVENLAQRLSEVGTCADSRSVVLQSSARVAELAEADSPFVLSNRCDDVQCLLPSTDAADAGQ